MEIHGHRGARGLYPENTITAFTNAILLGVDAIELDVVISNDRQVVVSHEPWMNHKTCSEPDGSHVKMLKQHNIFKMDYEVIRQYDCGKRLHPYFPKQKTCAEYKPLLKEVIEKIEVFIQKNKLKPVIYNIEIKCRKLSDNTFHPKPDEFSLLLYNTIKPYGIDERIMLQSFDYRSLQKLHQLDNQLKTALLVSNNLSFERNLERLGYIPYAYCPNFKLAKKRLIKKSHLLGMKVFTWTVNNNEIMQKLIKNGIDGIITDYPDIALSVRSELIK